MANINVDPLLSENFELSSNSPCINNGAPRSLRDPDGTTRDIGAYYYDLSSFVGFNNQRKFIEGGGIGF
jgi:hypothetical protein